MNIAIVLGLLVVLGALAAAGFFMIRGGGATESGDDTRGENANAKRRMARALTVRIAVSVAVFLAVLLAWHFGVLKPGGLPVGK